MNDLEIHRLIVENKKLQKALDKACEEIVSAHDGHYGIDLEINGEIKFYGEVTKEEWKEWCLKDD